MVLTITIVLLGFNLLSAFNRIHTATKVKSFDTYMALLHMCASGMLISTLINLRV